MKLASLFSGGKDSTYAMYLARKEHDIVCLISVVSENKYSYMFHTPNIELVNTQAKVLELPLLKAHSKGEKEKELDDLKSIIKIAVEKYRIEGIVTGAIASKYQKSRVDSICSELGLKSIAPLWNRNDIMLLKEMVDAGFEIIITAVAAPPLNETWLGRRIDDACIDEIEILQKKYGISPIFEGGEAETFVLFCSLFGERIEILDSVKHWNAEMRNGWLEIKNVQLINF